MLNSFTFRSIGKPDEIGYMVTRDYDCTLRHGVCRWAQFFQTYGDGLIQHSKEVPFSTDLLPDFLQSLAYYLASENDKRADALDIVADHWPKQPFSNDQIRFAFSLKGHATKTVYYNMDDRKQTTAQSKRHDRRWEKIETWNAENFKGDCASAARVLFLAFPAYDILHGIKGWRDIIDFSRADNDGYCAFDVWDQFKIGTDTQGHNTNWHVESAWRAVESFVQSHRLIMDAKRIVENAAWTRMADAEKVSA